MISKVAYVTPLLLPARFGMFLLVNETGRGVASNVAVNYLVLVLYHQCGT